MLCGDKMASEHRMVLLALTCLSIYFVFLRDTRQTLRALGQICSGDFTSAGARRRDAGDATLDSGAPPVVYPVPGVYRGSAILHVSMTWT